jgi:predicted transcriptional regulator
MIGSEHILISLESRHAENILSGRKRVELRRRSMRVSPGATVWMYVKLPVGSIIGRATVKSVDSTTPLQLWRRYGAVSGLSRQEFFEYFEGADSGVALVLDEEVRLKNPFSLKALREFDEDFQPPQFFARLTPGHPLHSAVAAYA